MKLKINVRNESFTVEWHLDVAIHAKKKAKDEKILNQLECKAINYHDMNLCVALYFVFKLQAMLRQFQRMIFK